MYVALESVFVLFDQGGVAVLVGYEQCRAQ